ncbi:MAG: type II toxin-antitoxin system prevent-host-death family antitoxin [Leucobacter sp.]
MSTAQIPNGLPEPPSVGIRALKQNASEVVARAAAGEVIQITDRGRPVAEIIPIRQDRLQQLIDSGRVTMPTESIAEFIQRRDEHYAELEASGIPTGNTSGMTMQEILDEQRAERF